MPAWKDRAVSTASTLGSVSPPDMSAPPRIALPSDLAASLRHLDDVELRRLLDAVTTEVNRRNQDASVSIPSKDASSPAKQARERRGQAISVEDITEGKATLIRVAFGAGLKPAAIARTVGVSLSLVNRVLRAAEKPK